MALPVTDGGFDFKNKKCDAKFYNEIDNKGEEIQLLRVKNLDKNVSFNVRDPFSRKADMGESNILMDFISIDYGNVESLEEFFRLNGFLFNIGNEDYSLFKCKDLFLTSNIMKILIEVIDELTKTEPDYIKLIKHTTYLLLVPPILLEVDENTTYSSSNSSNANFIQDLISDEPNYYDSEGDFLNEDALYINDYAWENLYESYISSFAYEDFESNYRMDFLSIVYNHIYCIDLRNTAILSNEKLDLEQSDKTTILDTARKILKEDIDHHLSNITPTYNSESLEASWDIPDLITALYFSILFLNPNFKILKKCSNPNCINYFTVHKSNNRKMYCSEACGNAMSQRRFRERNKENI